MTEMTERAKQFRKEECENYERGRGGAGLSTYVKYDEPALMAAFAAKEVERAALAKFADDSATPGTDLARWIWCRFVGIPITEPYDKEFRMLLLKIASYEDEMKQRASMEKMRSH